MDPTPFLFVGALLLGGIGYIAYTVYKGPRASSIRALTSIRGSTVANAVERARVRITARAAALDAPTVAPITGRSVVAWHVIGHDRTPGRIHVREVSDAVDFVLVDASGAQAIVRVGRTFKNHLDMRPQSIAMMQAARPRC